MKRSPENITLSNIPIKERPHLPNCEKKKRQVAV